MWLHLIKRGVGTAALLAMVLPTTGEGQQTSLRNPTAVFSEGFSFVSRVRELPDGRVIVADPLGQVLLIVNMDEEWADTVGRVGAGPREYRQPDAVFALPGDSTLLVDLGNARLITLGPDGTFGSTAPIAQGEPSGPGLGGMMIVLPSAVDGQGNVYFRPMMGGMGPGRSPPDSAPVVRWHRGTSRFDTVATVKLQELSISNTGGRNNMMQRMEPVPYSMQDGWDVGADGSVVVVRSNPYRVEWYRTGEAPVRGPAVDYRPRGVSRADKEAWEQRIGNGLSVGVTMDNGQRQMSFGRGGRGGFGGTRALDDYPWPDVMPAFDPGRVWATPDGKVWVQRYGTGDAPEFDVFDGQGRRTGQITLPAGRRVVGFGSGTVYLVMTDEFDLLYLERYTYST